MNLHKAIINIVHRICYLWPNTAGVHLDQSTYEEHKLLALLADGSEYAFQMIYDRHRNRIYQTAIRYLKSPQLGQEVVQDVFMKLWFQRQELRPDHPIEAWLYTVARNNIFNRLKKIASEWKALDHLAHFSPATIDAVSQKIDTDEYGAMLQQALKALPTQQHKVFELARREKLSYVQIGELLKISPLTVKTHMSRALQHIRQFFTQQGIKLPAFIIVFLFF